MWELMRGHIYHHSLSSPLIPEPFKTGSFPRKNRAFLYKCQLHGKAIDKNMKM